MSLRSVAGLFAAAMIAIANPPASRHHFSISGALTAPSDRSPEEIAWDFVRQIAPEYGVSDVASVYLARQYRTDHNGITHVLFRQQFAGVDAAYSEFVVNVNASGQVLNAGGTLFPAPAPALPPAAATLAPSMRAAMRHADPEGSGEQTPIEVQSSGKTRRFARLDRKRATVDARPLWYPVDGKLVPAWRFYVDDSTGKRIAATFDSASQVLLESRDLTQFFQAPVPPRGLVFTGTSPRPNPRPGYWMTERPPFVNRSLVSFAGDPQASPAGWVEGTETEGNNAIVGRNPLGEVFLVQPTTAKSPQRDFQFPLELGPSAPNPTNYQDAAITNLFYWMNRSHDLFWHAGFNEAAGAYQKRNFGRGGVEGDPMYAYAHFGVEQTFQAALTNAFYTAQGYEDGSPAMIGMFLAVGPDGYFTDGSLDAEVMVHEYTHGVTRRLVQNLTGHHGGAMSEAWSDFFALEFTTPEGAPPGGTYAAGDYFAQRMNTGIRTRPYSTDMSVNPITFADFGRVAFLPAIHNDAGVWVQALLEMRANLIGQFGETEGRRRARLLVIDGMKLSVPSPTLVDARDAILLADRTGFRGESQSQIWEGFAKRGLGVTAYAPSNNSTRVMPSFDRPSGSAMIAFSEPSFVFGEAARVILYDPTLTGDITTVDLTSYEVGTDVQTIRLRRSGSYYTGIVPTSNNAPAVRQDGGLAVMPGSFVSAYYLDADAQGGAKQISASVPMQPNYTRITRTPSFRFANETPLPLRAGPGAITTRELPFEFPFYGRTYSAVNVLSNGLLAFSLPPVSQCSDVSALRLITGIAPMYGSIRTDGSAQPNENVYVGRPSDDSVSFRWAGETQVQPGLGSPEPVNFGVTLYRDGRIEFQYGTGNRTVTFPSPTASVCTAAPSIGISSGSGTAVSLVTEYIGRANVENANSITFEPPFGASSTPQIRIEVPNATDTYAGIVTGRILIWDNETFVPEVYVLIDGILRGRAGVNTAGMQACQAERLPNCVPYQFNYNLADLKLDPGPHSVRIVAINARGGRSEASVDFNAGEGQSRVPAVQIELPENNAEVSGNITVRGYAAAPNLRIVGIDVIVDGVNYGRAGYGQPRPEICSALGFESPNCPGVGFMFAINSAAGSIPLPNGEHLLRLRIQDETGRFTLYPETPLTIRVTNQANESPRGFMTSPSNGQRVSGTILVWGWAWDPDGRIVRADVLVDGVVRGQANYGETRPEQCASLPDVAACPNIGFWYEFNTRTLLNGPHLIGVRLLDDRGRSVVIPQDAANGSTIIVQN